MRGNNWWRNFIPSVGWTTSFPAEISLEFHGPGRNITAKDLNKFVRQEVIPIIEDQLKLVTTQSNNENVAAFLARVNIFSDRINRFGAYLNSWSEKMTFGRYKEMRRRNYYNDIEELMRRFNEFATERQNEEGQARVREMILQIEQSEIRNIYGGDILESL